MWTQQVRLNEIKKTRTQYTMKYVNERKSQRNRSEKKREEEKIFKREKILEEVEKRNVFSNKLKHCE